MCVLLYFSIISTQILYIFIWNGLQPNLTTTNLISNQYYYILTKNI